jgi:hypothetical protein
VVFGCLQDPLFPEVVNQDPELEKSLPKYRGSLENGRLMVSVHQVRDGSTPMMDFGFSFDPEKQLRHLDAEIELPNGDSSYVLLERI